MTPTLVTSGTSITASPTASVNTASVSPANNALLLMAVAVSKSPATGVNPTLSGLGLTWTRIGDLVYAHGSPNTRDTVALFWAQGVVTPGVVTISIGSTGTSTGWAWILASVNDVAVGSGSSLFGELASSLGLESLSLSVVPLTRTDNIRIGVVGSTAQDTTSTDIAGLDIITSVAHAAPVGFLAMGWRSDGSDPIIVSADGTLGIAALSVEAHYAKWPSSVASGAQA